MMQSKHLFFGLLLLFIACSPEEEQNELPEPFFKATINDQSFYYKDTFPNILLGQGIILSTQDSIFSQTTTLGAKWNTNPKAVDIRLYFNEKPSASYFENLIGQNLMNLADTISLVNIFIFNGNSLLDVEISNMEPDQTGSLFKITELIEDPNFVMNIPTFTLGKAFLAKGVCNFRTPNLRVTNGEFVIRLVEMK